MDAEILIWVAIFVGGYALVLAFLLKRALSKKANGAGEPGPD